MQMDTGFGEVEKKGGGSQNCTRNKRAVPNKPNSVKKRNDKPKDKKKPEPGKR